MKTHLSVARGAAFTGLLLSLLHQLVLLFVVTGPRLALSGLASGDKKTIALALLALIDLIVMLPFWRQRKWGLFLGLLTMVAMLFFGGKFMLQGVGHPEQFLPWVWSLLSLVGIANGLAFGVVAFLEASGRMEPASLQSRQGAVLKALGCASAGMILLGAVLALAPSDAGAMAQAPDNVVTVTLQQVRFTPNHLEVPVGKRTAVFLINHDPMSHSFDIDALNVHVSVPAGGATVAMLQPTTAGNLEYYCSVPGHKAAGMTGTLTVK